MFHAPRGLSLDYSTLIEPKITNEVNFNRLSIYIPGIGIIPRYRSEMIYRYSSEFYSSA